MNQYLAGAGAGRAGGAARLGGGLADRPRRPIFDQFGCQKTRTSDAICSQIKNQIVNMQLVKNSWRRQTSFTTVELKTCDVMFLYKSERVSETLKTFFSLPRRREMDDKSKRCVFFRRLQILAKKKNTIQKERESCGGLRKK